MPRLSYPHITRGQAIACLIRVYRDDYDFAREQRHLRQPYVQLLSELTSAWLTFGAACRGVLTPKKFHEFSANYFLKRDKPIELPKPLADCLSWVEQKQHELQPYIENLAKLAYNWKLRAPWAVTVLLLFDMTEICHKLGIPEEVEIPVGFLDYIYPFPPPAPPLEITVSAWAFILYRREEILSQINDKLRGYEEQLKAKRLKERPSRMERHAQWWFEHYVHGKAYDEIAQMETCTPGGSLISYARNVGIAIRNFSKLIGIEVKDLK